MLDFFDDFGCGWYCGVGGFSYCVVDWFLYWLVVDGYGRWCDVWCGYGVIW